MKLRCSRAEAAPLQNKSKSSFVQPQFLAGRHDDFWNVTSLFIDDDDYYDDAYSMVAGDAMALGFLRLLMLGKTFV